MSDSLRVAVVHSYYSDRMPSGENVVVDLQVQALRRAGHEVEVFAVHQNEVEQGRLYTAKAAFRAGTNRGRGPAVELEDFGPDVVHVHNLFPNFGRTWTSRFKDRLVATLHNYRPICPASTLFRDGHACTLCPDHHSSRFAVRYACYRGSRMATLPMAMGIRFEKDPLLLNARRIVTLSEDMRTHYAAVGVPAEKLTTVPNFVPANRTRGKHDGGFWLYVGRFSPEKGILPLVERWPTGVLLKVVGDGQLDQEVRRAAGPAVQVLGTLSQDEVRTLMGAATGLVFPSLWPEGLPTVYLEALAAGTPVLASQQSVVGSLVAAEGTGLVTGRFDKTDLDQATATFPRLVDHCRRTFEARYTEAAWVSAMEEVYRSVPRAL